MAKSGFEFSKSNVWAAIGGNDTLYVNPPITWTLFLPRSPKKNYRLDDLDPSTTTENTATTVTKRQRTSTTTTNTRSNNTRATTNTQRGREELSETQINNAKKTGCLIVRGPRIPLFSHTFKTFGNKQLCPGFCYLDKYCYYPQTCNKAHISGFEYIKNDTDRAATISWVESQPQVNFAPGKGPTGPG